MTGIDYAIVGIIALSALFSILRGFVKEVLSLLGWVSAFFIAKIYYVSGAEWLTGSIESDMARHVVAWILLFLLTLIGFAILNKLIAQVISQSGLSAIDRILGMVFGALRGVLVITLVVVLMRQFTAVETESWWASSTVLPHIALLADWFSDNFAMPEDSVESVGSAFSQHFSPNLSEIMQDSE